MGSEKVLMFTLEPDKEGTRKEAVRRRDPKKKITREGKGK